MKQKKKIAILGSTGSIGDSVLQVVAHNRDSFQITALSCYANSKKLSEQITDFSPQSVCIFQEASKVHLQPETELFVGASGLKQMIRKIRADLVVCAISGYQGIYSMLEAIWQKIPVAIANKEPLVVAGKIVMEEARRNSVPIYPIDSEHNAIAQCLGQEALANVSKIILTASGGPFLHTTKENFADITLQQVLQHPKWKMGAKNTIDSATTMNKALEIIEAKWLFGLQLDQIAIVVHPQSILHGAVQYNDGSSLAQLGLPDMKIAISYCLGENDRISSSVQNIDFLTLEQLEFLPLDEEKFPCVALMRECFLLGEGLPAAMNGINEVFVQSLLAEKISFSQLMQGYSFWMTYVRDVVASTHCPPFLKKLHSLQDALQANQWGMDTFSKIKFC